MNPYYLPGQSVTTQNILDATIEATGVTINEIQSKSKIAICVIPRTIYAILAMKYTLDSHSVICGLIKRDRTTAFNYYKIHESYLFSRDTKYIELFTKVKTNIGRNRK